MSNTFGGFTTTSPLSSLSHNAFNDLASNCVRDYFGPTCQTVFDCLITQGPSTLSQLMVKIRKHCKRDINPERSRLVEQMAPLNQRRSRAQLNLTRGNEEKGFIVNISAVRAALIVLLQHSLVKAQLPPKADGTASSTMAIDGKNVKFQYTVELERAVHLQRFPRYVEYARKTYKEEGAAIIEELLVHGRMTSHEVVKCSTECVGRYLSDDVSDEEKLVLAQKIIDAFKTMVDDGFLEIVDPIGRAPVNEEEEYDGNEKPEEKLLNEVADDDDVFMDGGDKIDTALQSILKAPKYKKSFIEGAVWRVNYKMFHASLRSIYLGKLVTERYNNKVPFSGAIVSAALKFTASKEFSPLFKMNSATEDERQRFLEEKTVFTPNDVMNFLPQTILGELKNKAGGARTNLSSLLTTMAQFNYPPTVVEVEEAQGHPDGGKFEIATRQLLSYLKGRILHQVVKDHYGDVGARICSILEAKGYMEGDTVAENAMVPAKDARELLHQLYKANYISMLYLQQSKQHNPATASYLWCVDKKRIHNTVLMNVCRALYNIRLRRQHEVEVGKEWIERAKFADDTDENHSEADKANYNRFCQGLERIDNACIQIDETLMVLNDFENI